MLGEGRDEWENSGKHVVKKRMLYNKCYKKEWQKEAVENQRKFLKNQKKINRKGEWKNIQQHDGNKQELGKELGPVQIPFGSITIFRKKSLGRS